MLYPLDSLRMVEASEQPQGTLLMAIAGNGTSRLILVAGSGEEADKLAVSLGGPQPFHVHRLAAFKGVVCPQLDAPRVEISEPTTDPTWLGTLMLDENGAWMALRIQGGFGDETAFLRLQDWVLHSNPPSSGERRYFDNWRLIDGPSDTPREIFQVTAALRV